ncbi:MAG: flagellar hook-basal body complex protein [Burkholderiales bacterium]|nr:flagellar hook-basal body complex protein [Burkholderiales bacterium]
MLDSIYVSLTGLEAFSKGLNTISTNVANLNTVAYKGEQARFAELVDQFSGNAQRGNPFQQNVAGVEVSGKSTRFAQGDLRETGNDLDLAVQGNGFFVVRDAENNLRYTRDGQFEVNREGELVTKQDGLKVQALMNGRLMNISTKGFELSSARPTTTIELTGNLSINDGDGRHEVSNFEVIDSLGRRNTLKLIFTRETADRTWTGRVEDATGNALATGQTVTFNTDGSITATRTEISFSYTPNGLPAQNVVVKLGTAGGFSGITSFSAGADSNASVAKQDGRVSGSLQTLKFTRTGVLEANYTNSDKKEVATLALASFVNTAQLERVDSKLWKFTGPAQNLEYGKPGEGAYGATLGGRIEASNIELAQEFGDLTIVQRGYQASSQILSTSNELIQQLMDATRNRS